MRKRKELAGESDLNTEIIYEERFPKKYTERRGTGRPKSQQSDGVNSLWSKKLKFQNS